MKMYLKFLPITFLLIITGCNVDNNEDIQLNMLSKIEFDKCTGVVRRDISLILQNHYGEIDKICLIEDVKGTIYKFKSGEIRLIEFSDLNKNTHSHYNDGSIIKNELLNK